MILLDSCILIDILNSAAGPPSAMPSTSELAVCGIVRAEVLTGARTSAARERARASLNVFHDVRITLRAWDEAGCARAALLAAGFTVPLTDILLAFVAIEAGIPLWTTDKHFRTIQQHYPQLVLYTPSAQSSGPAQP